MKVGVELSSLQERESFLKRKGKCSEREGSQTERCLGSTEVAAPPRAAPGENQRNGAWAEGAPYLGAHGMTGVKKQKTFVLFKMLFSIE